MALCQSGIVPDRLRVGVIGSSSTMSRDHNLSCNRLCMDKPMMRLPNTKYPDTEPDVEAILTAAFRKCQKHLTESQAKHLITAIGITVPSSAIVMKPQDAASALDVVASPVVVKVLSADIQHKTEVKGVEFPLQTAAETVAACERIEMNVARLRPDARIEGFLIESYCPAGFEWLLSGRIDDRFGPVVSFGLGGIYTDVLQRLGTRLAPLADRDIKFLINETGAGSVLSGFRGAAALNVAALQDAIARLSSFVISDLARKYVSEIEINPLAVTTERVLALDVLVGLRRNSK